MDTLLDAVYVINLDKDTERLSKFDEVMKLNNIKYIRYPGHTSHSSKYINSLFMSYSEIGCFLSHIALWNSIIENNHKRVLIFEDDARTHISGNTLYENINGLYTFLIKNNIDEPDILYLGKALDDCINYKHVWGTFYRNTHPLCLHSYIITNKGARTLLNMSPYNKTADLTIIDAIKYHGLNSMTSHPSIFYQDVIRDDSNLRNISSALNNTCECMIYQQHLIDKDWLIFIISIFALIASIVLISYYNL